MAAAISRVLNGTDQDYFILATSNMRVYRHMLCAFERLENGNAG